MLAVKIIERQAFFHCFKLTNVSIPSATIIELDAFDSCIALTNVNIPASVTTIERSAFYNCKNLKDVTVHWTDPSNIVNIKGKNVFHGISSSAVLHVPSGMRSAYIAKGWGEGFAEVLEDE